MMKRELERCYAILMPTLSHIYILPELSDFLDRFVLIYQALRLSKILGISNG